MGALNWTVAWHRQIILSGLVILVVVCVADIALVATGQRSISESVWLFEDANLIAIVLGGMVVVGSVYLVKSGWACCIIGMVYYHLCLVPITLASLPPVVSHKRGDIGPNEVQVWMQGFSTVVTIVTALGAAWTVWVSYLKYRDVGVKSTADITRS